MFRLILALITCGGAGGALYYVTTPDAAVSGYVDPKTKDVDDQKELPTNEEMERLAKTDPVRFLNNVLRRYNREVQGYSLTMSKQERMAGELKKKEVLAVHFRDEPHSVFLDWKQNAGLAQRVVFVEGQNNGNMLVKTATAISFIVQRNPEGAEARKTARYTLRQFGIKKGTMRTKASWEKAAKDNALHVEYLGKRKIREAGGQECWVLKRTKFKEPERDGMTEMTIFVSTKDWLQVGSILKDKDNKLIAEYYFWDIKLNPKFADDQFTRAALSK